MIEQMISVGKSLPTDLLSKTWQKVGPVGLFNMQHAIATVDGDIYILGGRVGESATARNGNTRYRGGVLTSLANLPTPIAAGCATAIGRKIYLMGGCVAIASGQQNRKLYVYDVDAGTYATETDSPFTSVVGSCVAIGTDIYVYGGMNDQNEGTFPKLFYKYDTLTKTWTSLPYHDGPALYSTACTTFDGKLYAFGGEYANASGGDANVRVFDPGTGTWSKLTTTGSAPGPRGAVALVKYDDTRFIAIGGRVGAGNRCTAETWMFDITTLKWTALNPLPVLVAFSAAGVIANGNVILFDGFNGGTATSATYTLM